MIVQNSPSQYFHWKNQSILYKKAELAWPSYLLVNVPQAIIQAYWKN